MSANTTLEQFDALETKSYDLIVHNQLARYHETKLDNAPNDYFVKKVEQI